MKSVSIQLESFSQLPRYLALAEALKAAILQGSYAPGDRLPAIRTLADALGLNNGTVVHALRTLVEAGFLRAVRGSGYYVCAPQDAHPALEEDAFCAETAPVEVAAGAINFGSTTPDARIFPIAPFKQALDAVLERDGGYAFGYQDSHGYAPLRATLREMTVQQMGYDIPHERVQIVSGAQQGIDVVSKAQLLPGDYVLCETPTYTGAVAAFTSRGAKVIGVPMQRDGMHLGLLEKYIRAYKPKLLYLMTTYQNPTTYCYSAGKLQKLMALLRKYDLLALEDDAMSGLDYEGAPPAGTLKALDRQNHHVIYIRSFSKLLMPGLRIGYLIAPARCSAHLAVAKHTTDISTSGLIQRALDLYFARGQWQRHTETMRAIYHEKYCVMREALRALAPLGVTFHDARGGLHFWVRLPEALQAAALEQACAAQGVLLAPGTYFYVGAADAHTLRLSFAAMDAPQIRRGVDIMGGCIQALLRAPRRRAPLII
nr:PLP-dependent aminotransferase family protein [Maliibacterium massiliense]